MSKDAALQRAFKGLDRTIETALKGFPARFGDGGIPPTRKPSVPAPIVVPALSPSPFGDAPADGNSAAHMMPDGSLMPGMAHGQARQRTGGI